MRIRRATTRGALAGLVGALAPVAASAQDCSPDAAAAETVTIAGIESDNRIRLQDGRLVQLAGLDTASLRLPALSGLEATLYSAGQPDRHGAVHGGLMLDGADLASRLVESGNAIVRPHPGEQFCATALLGLEESSRRNGLGLWRDPGYAVANAELSESVSGLVDRYAVVAGMVQHVGETKDAVWIDFGKIWRTDVTIVVSKKAWPRFEAAGLTVDRIKGRRIRARGVVSLRSGPRLDISEPAAIELLDAAAQTP